MVGSNSERLVKLANSVAYSKKTWLRVGRQTLDQLPDCSAFRRRKLAWEPVGFVIESERLEHKIIDASVQQKSLDRWTLNPKSPVNYFVCGSPDDEKAKYFAAYLIEIHRQRLGINADVCWEPVYNGYDNAIIKKDLTPSLIVLSNLSTKSNYLKYDKARDVVERFSSVPKIIICAGEDPISFAATRLHLPCHALAYFGSTLSKTFSEVI